MNRQLELDNAVIRSETRDDGSPMISVRNLNGEIEFYSDNLTNMLLFNILFELQKNNELLTILVADNT